MSKLRHSVHGILLFFFNEFIKAERLRPYKKLFPKKNGLQLIYESSRPFKTSHYSSKYGKYFTSRFNQSNF